MSKNLLFPPSILKTWRGQVLMSSWATGTYLNMMRTNEPSKPSNTVGINPILSDSWGPGTSKLGVEVKTDPKRMLLFDNCYTTVSGSFFAMCMFIFHKTEVQRVILICLWV